MRFHFVLIIFLSSFQSYSQETDVALWHNKERSIRYTPEGGDFIINNGDRRFNRALYGTNTGFRVEAGDLPEFALYMPGMGGNLQLGLITKSGSKWLIKAKGIQARYRPGSMLYEIRDPFLGEGTLKLTVLASSQAEGILVKVIANNVEVPIQLCWAFGGATGKRFSRDGDVGADPESSFFLKPEYCRDNTYTLASNTFTLQYGSGTPRQLSGIFPPGCELSVVDAARQESPDQLVHSEKSATPALGGTMELEQDKEFYFAIHNSASLTTELRYEDLSSAFTRAEEARRKLADRVQVITPDPYLNTLGGALAVAADAIWEDPSYLHGAVAWRMRLNAWRGASVADPLGWHDRAKKHFSSYGLSQLTTPETGPLAPDTALHFARHTEKLGNAMFSSGYICRNPNGDFRAHHYDMNLVFIDQLLTHFDWSGDTAYVREMWPLLKRHLAWERRNFDSDGDGLYDAYCCIWASDALQYSNGGVTHSSAYNYRANKVAAQLAALVGDDPTPFMSEASKIHEAIQRNLWMPKLGWYAEYKDFLGNRLIHPAAGLWTIYHAIDSNVPDAFQKYQSLRYVDTEIPHIPVRAKGLPDGDYQLLSTTNWQPYTWSINNVALAEMLHTSLAYWQGGRPDEGFKLWKSALVESMYLSASPGGFEQLSFYDAIRGELYRDFADPIGMAGRSLVEGLFGIHPRALEDTLVIRPGFPQAWDHASLTIPDITFEFKRQGTRDEYVIVPSFPTTMNLKLQIVAKTHLVKSITVNGQNVPWKNVTNATVGPVLEITPKAKSTRYVLQIEWSGDPISHPSYPKVQLEGKNLDASFGKATVLDIYDPQLVLDRSQIKNNNLSAKVKPNTGNKTVFVKLRQGSFEWWAPLDFTVKKQIEVTVPANQSADELHVEIRNHGKKIGGKLVVNPDVANYRIDLSLKDREKKSITIPPQYVLTGTNVIRCEMNNGIQIEQQVINWKISSGKKLTSVHVDLTDHFNASVTDIFKNKYLSPRPSSPTLQLPWQGIGNWCYPLVEPVIDDTGLRNLAGNSFAVSQEISFSTPAEAKKNIIYSSQWDNYPDSVVIPLSGQSSHAYFLMAGSTNPMQSRIVNGLILVRYTDNTETILELRNPENWWPIEQDYFVDGFAFRTDAPAPIRVHLKTGLITQTFKDYSSIKGFSNFAIDGGAATILDLPLNPDKRLKSLTLRTIANDVVIGLMSITLMR
jgi:hypothetical protein